VGIGEGDEISDEEETVDVGESDEA
jgi:hypothetical protein